MQTYHHIAKLSLMTKKVFVMRESFLAMNTHNLKNAIE